MKLNEKIESLEDTKALCDFLKGETDKLEGLLESFDENSGGLNMRELIEVIHHTARVSLLSSSVVTGLLEQVVEAKQVEEDLNRDIRELKESGKL